MNEFAYLNSGISNTHSSYAVRRGWFKKCCIQAN